MAYTVAWRDPAAIAGTDHRRDQGQAGPHRLPQPAADRLRRRPVPAHRLHADGLRHGPDGAWRRRRTRAPSWTRSATRCAREYPEGRYDCFKDNRATLHLHGGITPWISDGTPHQWITPPDETTPWPQGVSVQNVPDMGAAGCDAADDGCQTFYYTNQQSARLMFYHDHAWGITRLNVYAGEAAGYLISDDTEKAARSPAAPSPAQLTQIPLVVQDRTFVPGCTRSLRSAGSDLGYSPLGRQGQLLVPPRLHAGPEPRRPVGHECLRALDVRSLVLAAGCRYGVRTDRQPVLLIPNLQPGRPGHLAVPDRPVLRAAADPGHAEHLGRHGAVQRHADRERRGLPDDHAGTEVVPPAHAERGQRPLLQLPVVRRRPDSQGEPA